MKSKVTLVEPDGRETVVEEELTAEHVDGHWYMWVEGNWSCDCNKRLFIARARGESEPSDSKCGSSIKLKSIVLDDGERIYP